MASNYVSSRIGSRTFQTSYKIRVFNDFISNAAPRGSEGRSGPTPLVRTPARFTQNHFRPVILYDQLGNGESTHVRDKPAQAMAAGLPGHDEPLSVRGATDAKEYWGGATQFYRKHVLKLNVCPPEEAQSMVKVGDDSTVSWAMYSTCARHSRPQS